MKKHSLLGLLILTFVLSGCVARTYTLTRDRIDQDLSDGNRGYIMGKAPEASMERKETRTTRVVEIELGRSRRQISQYPAAGITKGSKLTENEMMKEEAAVESPMEEMEPTEISYEKYTVEKSDTLQKISRKFYGTTRKWPKIYNENKDTLKGPDKLYPGQVLKIPLEDAGRMKETRENLK